MAFKTLPNAHLLSLGLSTCYRNPYLRERNAQIRAKRLTAEMVLARERDELIEKELVLRQLAFIMIAFRQAVLALPGKLRAAIGAGFTHEMVQQARGAGL
ncbi:MAG: hypothetical protein JO279_18505 [Verrucomicrobia bacterium]|nr:hypothetical protein [Verrucomicrobiota bacterium]